MALTDLNYKVIEVEKRENLWYYLCVKLNDEYRYYGLVYDSETDIILVSLVDSDLKTIDHFIRSKGKFKNPLELFLDLCIAYDKFVYPELFETA